MHTNYHRQHSKKHVPTNTCTHIDIYSHKNTYTHAYIIYTYTHKTHEQMPFFRHILQDFWWV